MNHVYFFGCWNESGHYLFAPNKGYVPWDVEQRVVWYGDRMHLDGTLAPRTVRPGTRTWYAQGTLSEHPLVWQGAGATQDDRDRIKYDSDECPQGQFLLHHLDNGFTAIQWWDRCQGDKRGACNSTVLLEGKHTAEEMLTTLFESFPHVAKNLEAHNVKLVEVVLP